MKANLGTLDKAIRILAAVAIAGLYFANVITGLVATILLVLAGIFFVTGIVSFCPLYWSIGISTRKKEAEVK